MPTKEMGKLKSPKCMLNKCAVLPMGGKDVD